MKFAIRNCKTESDALKIRKTQGRNFRFCYSTARAYIYSMRARQDPWPPFQCCFELESAFLNFPFCGFIHPTTFVLRELDIEDSTRWIYFHLNRNHYERLNYFPHYYVRVSLNSEIIHQNYYFR